MMDIKDIDRVCDAARLLTRKNNLRPANGTVVVSWEFGSVSSFLEAEYELMHAMRPEIAHGLPRRVDDDTIEIDHRGVTFRLSCRVKIYTPRGSVHAPDVKMRYLGDAEIGATGTPLTGATP